VKNPTRRGHLFHPGVLSAAGDYSAAKLSSTIGTHHYYVVTIPIAARLNLFVDTDLTQLDSSGKLVATRKPSATIISGGEGPVNLSFSVQ
jgi:hypothetical protein